MALQVDATQTQNMTETTAPVILVEVYSSKKQDVKQEILTSSPVQRADMVGNKRLARLGSSPVMAPAPMAPATTTSTTTPVSAEPAVALAPSGPSTMDQIFALLQTVATSLCDMEATTASTLNYASEMGQKSSAIALVNQQNTTEQLNKISKQQHRMNIISRCVKAVAITILVVAVVTGQPELAPISTLLMTALTTIMIADPELITNGLVTPLSKGLQSLGVPEGVADLLAKVIVITVLAVATAGVGAAADGAGLAGLATDAAARLGKTVSTETVDYAGVFVGNYLLAMGEGIGITQPFAELFNLMLPNDPKIAAILGTTFDLLASIATMVAGGVSLKSSGVLSGMAANEGSTFLRYGQNAKVGLQFLQPVFSFMSGVISLEQAKAFKALAESKADSILSQQSVRTSSSLSQTTSAQLQQIVSLLQQLAATSQSFTMPGAKVLQNMRG
jgi:hypothetical protein